MEYWRKELEEEPAAGPLTEAERHQVLVEWNDTRREASRSPRLHQLFEAHADRSPEAPAVISNQGQWSYAELDREANRLARYLRAQGVGPDVPVALYLERGFELMTALVATLKAGGAYLGLDLQSPPERLAWVLEDSGAPLVLTTETMAGKLPESGARVVCLDRDRAAWRDLSPERLPVETDVDHLHGLIYTSGSTGRPKGTLATIRNYLNLIQWFTESTAFGAHSRTLLVTGLNWDATFRTAFTALTSGGATVLADNGPFDPRKVLATIARHRVTVINVPMSLIQPVLEAAAEDGFRGLSSLEYLCLGGEAVVNARLRDWLHSEACGSEVRNVYGLTETSDVSVVEDVRREEVDRLETVPLGRTVRNHRVYVLGPGGEPLPPGVPGEIAIAGEEGLTRGYHRRPDLTADRFRPDPFGNGGRLYRTGDLGRWLPDGRLEYRGRADHQVKVRGMRVELGEIEEHLRQHPRIREAVVLVKQPASGDRRLAGYVLPAPGTVLSAAEIGDFLRARVPDFMVPQTFVMLDELPLNASGKADRQALPEPDWERDRSDLPDYVEPRGEEERELARIYSQLLGARRIGAGDHFFALGGHSLLALQLLSHVRDVLSVEVPLQRLFQAPTVRDLARVVVELRHAARNAGPAAQASRREQEAWETVLVALQLDGDEPPLFCIHPATGSVLAYRELAEALGEEQPFYGFQSPDPDALDQPIPSIEAMAVAYLERLRRLEDDRPIVIAGWSMGGLVALEMARQARAAASPEVSLLVLMDATPPGLFEEPASEALTLSLFARNLGDEAGRRFDLPVAELEALDPERRWEHFLFKARADRKLLAPGSTSDHLAQLYRSFKMNVRAIHGYAPEPYDGPVALFVAEEGLQGLPQSWRRWVAGPLDVQEIPGDHLSFLKPPHVGVLARRLAAAITAAGTAAPRSSPGDLAEQRHS